MKLPLRHRFAGPIKLPMMRTILKSEKYPSDIFCWARTLPMRMGLKSENNRLLGQMMNEDESESENNHPISFFAGPRKVADGDEDEPEK